MLCRKILLGIFIFNVFIIQTLCMEKINGPHLETLKEFIDNYSKEAVAKALKNQSPSFMSSSVNFFLESSTIKTVAYSTLVATILGIAFSRSKYCWITPKSFDNLLQKKEEEFFDAVLEFKELVAASQENVQSVYSTNFNGIQAGVAAINNQIEQSQAEVGDIYCKALQAEFERRVNLQIKASIASRFIGAGFNRLETSMDHLTEYTEKTDESFREKLIEQEEYLEASRESSTQSFEKETSEMSNSYNLTLASLKDLDNNETSDYEELSRMITHTELMAKVLGKRLVTISENNQEQQEALSTIFHHPQNLSALTDQLEALQGITQQGEGSSLLENSN